MSGYYEISGIPLGWQGYISPTHQYYTFDGYNSNIDYIDGELTINIDATLKQPTPLGPGSQTGSSHESNQFQLIWQGGGPKYEARLWDANTPDCAILGTPQQNDCVYQAILTTPQTPTITVANGETYYWKVRSIDGVTDEITGPWSATYQLTTSLPVPPAPTGLSATVHAYGSNMVYKLKWTSPTPHHYNLEYVNLSTNASSGVITVSGQERIRYVDVDPSTAYQWSISSCNADNECNSTSATFVTEPINLNPSGFIDHTTNVDLSWAVESGYSYDIMFHEAGDPQWQWFGNRTSSVRIPGPLARGKTYEWQARTVYSQSGQEVESGWVEKSFTVRLAPPTSGSPGYEYSVQTVSAPGQALNLNWYGPSDMGPLYEVRVWESGDESACVGSSTSGCFFHEDDLTTTQVSLSGLDYDIVYAWRVRSRNVAGLVSAWSPTYSFKPIEAVLAAPSLNTPSPNATNIPLSGQVLTWDPVDDATEYGVEVREEDASTLFYSGIRATNSITLGADYDTHPHDLEPNTQYEWRVFADADNYGRSPFTDWRRFTTRDDETEPPRPGLLSPDNAAAGVALKPTFKWQRASTAIRYDLQLSQSIDFDQNTETASDLDSDYLCGSDQYCYPWPTQLAEGTTYYWCMRSWNGAGYSDWTLPNRYFTTLTVIQAPTDPPVLVSPGNATTVAIEPTLRWEPVDQAESYQVQVATDEAFSNVVGGTAGHTERCWLSDDLCWEISLDPGTTYYWRARGRNSIDWGPWSSTPAWSFTTEDVDPVDPRISINPTQLSASYTSGADPVQTLTISNVGGALLTWDIIEQISWLSLNDYQDEAAPGASFQVEVTFHAATLEPGLYTGSFIIDSNDDVQPSLEVDVSLNVGGDAPCTWSVCQESPRNGAIVSDADPTPTLHFELKRSYSRVAVVICYDDAPVGCPDDDPDAGFIAYREVNIGNLSVGHHSYELTEALDVTEGYIWRMAGELTGQTEDDAPSFPFPGNNGWDDSEVWAFSFGNTPTHVTISGTVTGAGAPLSGIEVRFTTSSGTDHPDAQTTGASGTYSNEYIPYGWSGTVAAVDPSGTYTFNPVQVTAYANQVIDFTSEDNAVTLSNLDPNGPTDIDPGNVTLTWDCTTSSGLPCTTTPPEGGRVRRLILSDDSFDDFDGILGFMSALALDGKTIPGTNDVLDVAYWIAEPSANNYRCVSPTERPTPHPDHPIVCNNGSNSDPDNDPAQASFRLIGQVLLKAQAAGVSVLKAENDYMTSVTDYLSGTAVNMLAGYIGAFCTAEDPCYIAAGGRLSTIVSALHQVDLATGDAEDRVIVSLVSMGYVGGNFTDNGKNMVDDPWAWKALFEQFPGLQVYHMPTQTDRDNMINSTRVDVGTFERGTSNPATMVYDIIRNGSVNDPGKWYTNRWYWWYDELPTDSWYMGDLYTLIPSIYSAQSHGIETITGHAPELTITTDTDGDQVILFDSGTASHATLTTFHFPLGGGYDPPDLMQSYYDIIAGWSTAAASMAGGYSYEVTISELTENFVQKSGGATTSPRLEVLSYDFEAACGTNYSWQVKAFYMLGQTAVATSDLAYFATVPCTDPNAIVLVNPADLAPDVSPEVIDFEWQEHTAYPTFELELSETADFTDSDGDGVADDLPLYIPISQYTQGSAPGLSRYTYDDTEHTENAGQGLILPESTYYWRMRGCGPSDCVEGDTEIGPWSNVFSFTTDISRPAPVPLGIRQDVTNVSPRRITEMEADRAVPIIAWSTVQEATGYEVQLTTRETDGEADFTEPMVLELALTALLSDTELSLYSDNEKLFGDNAPVDVLTSEGYLLDGLAGGETYYWRVAALFGTHGQGSWSEPWTFGTAPVSMKFFYYLKDHLGSVRATVNGHGNVVHYDDYYPFGLQMPERTEISDAPLERFTGHELDSETGQYYAGGRYYGPLGGRWLSVDPISDDYPSHSPYSYAANNPLSFIDPEGLEWFYYQADGDDEKRWHYHEDTPEMVVWGGEYDEEGNKVMKLQGGMVELLFYNGETLSWHQKDGSTLSLRAYSGRLDENGNIQVNRQWEEGVGPIPEGWFIVDPENVQNWDNLSILQKAAASVKRGEWPGGTIAWGEHRVPIEPYQYRNRGDFFIHGGTFPGSAGCIDLCENNKAFFSIFSVHYKPVGLHVRYNQ